MRPEKQTELKVVALVSLGQHPASGRARRADQDARAVEMGLKLAGDGLLALHVGDPKADGLRGYAGMGLSRLRVLEQSSGGDPVGVLSDYLPSEGADILLTGVRAEAGESSGMVPYLLGEALGWPVVPRIADILKVDKGYAELLQALPRGQRRRLRVRLPFVASVDSAAPAARQSAFGPASRAEVAVMPTVAEVDHELARWTFAPARKRPKRLKVVKARTAAERFKAATAKSQNEGGKVLKGAPATEQAQAIFDLLLEEGVLSLTPTLSQGERG